MGRARAPSFQLYRLSRHSRLEPEGSARAPGADPSEAIVVIDAGQPDPDPRFVWRRAYRPAGRGQPASAQVRPQVKAEFGLMAATFALPEGAVTAYLPDDVASGETFSGTVDGPDGFVLTFGDQRARTGEPFSWTVPDRRAAPAYLDHAARSTGQRALAGMASDRSRAAARRRVPLSAARPGRQTPSHSGIARRRFPDHARRNQRLGGVPIDRIRPAGHRPGTEQPDRAGVRRR